MYELTSTIIIITTFVIIAVGVSFHKSPPPPSIHGGSFKAKDLQDYKKILAKFIIFSNTLRITSCFAKTQIECPFFCLPRSRDEGLGWQGAESIPLQNVFVSNFKMYLSQIAKCICLKNCTTTVAHICSINKMGRLHRMLILKACPYQQILSSKGTETTNGTTSQHHPYQQICWSTRWVNRPDCSFWPPFDISCHPETTKWVARPICLYMLSANPSNAEKIVVCSSKIWYFNAKIIITAICVQQQKIWKSKRCATLQ